MRQKGILVRNDLIVYVCWSVDGSVYVGQGIPRRDLVSMKEHNCVGSRVIARNLTIVEACSLEQNTWETYQEAAVPLINACEPQSTHWQLWHKLSDQDREKYRRQRSEKFKAWWAAKTPEEREAFRLIMKRAHSADATREKMREVRLSQGSIISEGGRRRIGESA
jgi:hypothetical protein